MADGRFELRHAGAWVNSCHRQWMPVIRSTNSSADRRSPSTVGVVQRQCVSSGGPFEDIYGYHRAVRVGGHVHVSGTTAREPDLDADAYTQALAAFAIIEEALLGVGSSLEAVVRTVTYVRDMADADLVARAHCETLATCALRQLSSP